jgi:hypothetical protein
MGLQPTANKGGMEMDALGRWVNDVQEGGRIERALRSRLAHFAQLVEAGER